MSQGLPRRCGWECRSRPDAAESVLERGGGLGVAGEVGELHGLNGRLLGAGLRDGAGYVGLVVSEDVAFEPQGLVAPGRRIARSRSQTMATGLSAKTLREMSGREGSMMSRASRLLPMKAFSCTVSRLPWSTTCRPSRYSRGRCGGR